MVGKIWAGGLAAALLASGSANAAVKPDTSLLSQADARIGACVNMGNHLEPPKEGDWGRPINATDFRDIRAVGFRTIRLPVRFSNHAATTPPYTIDPVFFARVDAVVADARANGLRVILDVHHYDDPQGSIFADPLGQRARLAGLWAQIAARYAHYDKNELWFEILNEPHNKITNANLRKILRPSLLAIRRVDASRPVVIGGENWSGVNSLATLKLPPDPYLITTFHYYDPYRFTHQGATWVSPVMPTGVTYGSTADAAALKADVAKVVTYMKARGRPVFLGEYGVFEGVPLAQRARYYKAVRDAFNGIGVDGCVWGYTNTFGFRHPTTGVWNHTLLRAIGL